MKINKYEESMNEQSKDSVIGAVYEAEDSMKTAELKVGAIGWKQISLSPFKRVEVVGCGSDFSGKFWFDPSAQKGKLGKVYTSESGFTPARRKKNGIGWLVEAVEPEEKRVQVKYVPPRKGFWCKVGSLG